MRTGTAGSPGDVWLCVQPGPIPGPSGQQISLSCAPRGWLPTHWAQRAGEGGRFRWAGGWSRENPGRRNGTGVLRGLFLGGLVWTPLQIRGQVAPIPGSGYQTQPLSTRPGGPEVWGRPEHLCP